MTSKISDTTSARDSIEEKKISVNILNTYLDNVKMSRVLLTTNNRKQHHLLTTRRQYTLLMLIIWSIKYSNELKGFRETHTMIELSIPQIDCDTISDVNRDGSPSQKPPPPPVGDLRTCAGANCIVASFYANR